MFNVDAFNNDMAKRSVPGSAAQFTIGGGGKRAMLYVFTPSLIPQQVLRPYKYDFNDNLVDEIVTAKDRMTKSIAPNGLGLRSANVNAAILPNPVGIPLDMTTIANQWTFVLIIDTAPATFDTRRVLHSPTSRIIATGFCSQEPVNPYTGTINPHAVLMFTKSNMTYVRPSLGNTGVSEEIQNANDLDVVSEVNAMVTPSTDLYVGTPQDIRSAITTDPTGEMYGVYGDLCLNNIKQDQGARLISGQLKTPKIQLGDIVRAVDSGIDYALSHEDCVHSVLTPNALEDPADIAKAAFNENVRGSSEMLPRNGLDTSQPIAMSQLAYLFPDLEVVPFEIPAASPWDTTPQDLMTARNSMSSMLSASLSNLAPSCGLANIMFRYASYYQTGPTAFANNRGVWEIMSYGTLVECAPRRQEACITTFKEYFEQELVPILKLVRGDFDLMAYIDVSGYILIDLNFKDDFGQQLGEGFYETSSRLGGFVNPMLADLNTLNHNGTQLEALVTQTIGKKIGWSGMNKPIFESQPTPFMSAPVQQPVDYAVSTAPQPTAPRGDYSNLI